MRSILNGVTYLVCIGVSGVSAATALGCSTVVEEASGTSPDAIAVDCPEWVPQRWYPAGTVVLYQGQAYRAEHDNPGYDPTISTWYWEPAPDACSVVEASPDGQGSKPDPPTGPFVRRDPGFSPELDFAARPAYLKPDEVVLTFDDGPDDLGNTDAVLDILKARGIKAAFFLNSDSQVPVATSSRAQNTIKRIVAEGHELANHSVHHYLHDEAKTPSDPKQHFSFGTPERIASEITGVEDALGAALGEGSRPLTLFRAPQGYPYSPYARELFPQNYANVAAVVRRYAVHVGWNIDSNDWRCTQPDNASQARCVHANIVGELDKGAYGILLMHSVGTSTVAALPAILDTLGERNFKFKTVEDAVRGAFGGKSSRQIMADEAGAEEPGGQTPDASSAWSRANLTNYTSYPDPGSEECIKYNGCTWAGQFAALPDKMPESWVQENNIIAIHGKDFERYRMKTFRLRQGDKQIDAKVYDMCADTDCSGCCTENSKETGFLIDVEKYTMQRFGAGDGIVEWTCLDCE
ncbi:hypothetical protein EON77_01215 [bacterium]|nr:MAG: hypothetical protein EON77_01215 [bacterium]